MSKEKLQLPQTKFSMKANLPMREPPINDEIREKQPSPPLGRRGLSDLQLTALSNIETSAMTDQVLALTVPPGAVGGDLIRFATSVGAIVAEVPEGAQEGQPFFVQLQPIS